ncbi:Integrin alpha chain,Integrin domain,Integrin alpha-2,FG-GAP repeat,Integrin alpha beta-propellor [Cinara cedri]|uniref:Integrin alpha chain,Integrin domain,Integrin alpha-2,FG-GAP repeat,Integrin alpha beta-propellor n=1 Tax=Cinara cedri TaxID=506608 RepID=A0A5E4MXZ5_9HEMI|nr:Integrin alpha chain,Integrin domain,Integrin alpha-2,FG-GAP repeat,Integrin alpha beta-propellor [Cinara cedri]
MIPLQSPCYVFKVYYYYAILLTMLCGNEVLGYNVDVTHFVRHRGPIGSMFGFSVAQYKVPGESWLLIGAPKADNIQPGVNEGGSVYKCSTSTDNECEPIMFDTRGNNSSTESIQRDSKSYNWLGATVKSSADSRTVLACAPRYVYFNYKGFEVMRKDPIGMCYVTRDLHHFSEYSPCQIGDNMTERDQGTCQAGLGASISKDGNRIFIGAVGRRFWQGQFFSKNLNGQQEVFSTNEGPKSDDDSYLGYSVAVGTFGFGSESGAAVGMPRGSELSGKVVLYSANLKILYNILGDQIGSYFGYSICVSDIDGDGGDDIIVGAPMYHEYSKNNDSYETGKVYVYLKNEGYAFYERNTRLGFNSKSRFGLALSNLGDINRDGYGDFAVGAPYDGPNELGAVYIYHGAKMGFRKKYSQVIKSEDVSIGQPPVSTFGFSLAGGTDLDNNQYPDLIIGAYQSDTTYLMKSRPVAHITALLYYKSNNKQIQFEHRECTNKDGTRVSCLFLIACLQYTGIGIDDQLNIETHLVLDARLKSPRMFFLSEENQNIKNNSLILKKKNTHYCLTFQVYLKNNIRDKLTPLEAELRHRIIEDTQRSTTLTPVIDTENEQFAISRASINIYNYCGNDNICIPDLRLIAMPNSESYLLGSNEKLKVDVKVQNLGEDSFETTFDMILPTGVNYVKIERLDDNEKNIPVQCSAPSKMTNNTLHCDIGNPLPGNKYIQFMVVLEPYQTTETKVARYEFNMMVKSTNPENLNSVSDNAKSLTIPLWVDTELIIEGSSKPTDVYFNVSMMEENLNIIEEKQIGPQVVHVYVIRNKGPADILEAEAYIDWPLFVMAGNPLLYLLEMPETIGQVKCEPIEDINPFKLNIDHKRKSYFKSSGLKLLERLPINITNEDDLLGNSNVKLKLYRRSERDITVLKKRCGPVLCVTIKCKIGPFSKDQDVGILFRSRMWVETLKKVEINQHLNLSSMISAKITRLPYIGKPVSDSKLAQVRVHEVLTQIISRDFAVKPNIIPMWIVILAAIAGTYVLLVLIYLLYKCEFFIRNRPSSAPEEQPLTHIKDQTLSDDK